MPTQMPTSSLFQSVLPRWAAV